MSKVLDEELKQAFSKLHEKMVDTKQKLKLADIQIEKLRRTKQRAELTTKEISSLPDDTRMYESVGRMFLLDKMNNIKDGLEGRIKTSDEKIKTLENNKTYLQRSLKESENEIREMIQQKQSKETSDTVNATLVTQSDDSDTSRRSAQEINPNCDRSA